MNLYAIRRPSGRRTAKQLEAAAARSKAVGDNEMSDDLRWIRSYVVREPDGGLGTICTTRRRARRRSANTRHWPTSRPTTSSRSSTR